MDLVAEKPLVDETYLFEYPTFFLVNATDGGALKGTDANPAMVDLFNEDTNFWNLEALSLFVETSKLADGIMMQTYFSLQISLSFAFSGICVKYITGLKKNIQKCS